MNKLEQEILDDLLYYNHNTWCRTFFRTDCQCDILENNMTEAFNGWILNARMKSSHTMLEEIKVQVMERIATMRQFIETWI